ISTRESTAGALAPCARTAAAVSEMTTTQTTVMKFGGTSVEDASAFERVASLVGRERASRPVVVVSAMSRFTDALLEAFDRAACGARDGAALSLEQHFARHAELARALLGSDAAAEIA